MQIDAGGNYTESKLLDKKSKYIIIYYKQSSFVIFLLKLTDV